MEFTKTNFVEGAARELKISVGEYLKHTDFNYVIFFKDQVDTWKDGSPIIYGDEMSVEEEIYLSDGFDDNHKMKTDFKVMTEWDFICTYCKDWLTTYLANHICNDDDNEYDGNCWIHWLDKGFNGSVNIDDTYTDILGAFVGTDGALSFNITDCDDTSNVFVSLWNFSNDVIYKISMSILCGLEFNQCAID